MDILLVLALFVLPGAVALTIGVLLPGRTSYFIWMALLGLPLCMAWFDLAVGAMMRLPLHRPSDVLRDSVFFAPLTAGFIAGLIIRGRRFR